MPRWHFLHIPDDVVPALRQSGVSEEQIRLMTVENPRRIFEAQGGVLRQRSSATARAAAPLMNVGRSRVVGVIGRGYNAGQFSPRNSGHQE